MIVSIIVRKAVVLFLRLLLTVYRLHVKLLSQFLSQLRLIIIEWILFESENFVVDLNLDA